MYTAILIIHIIVCLFVILVVLIQPSKGAEMGAMFGGGGSQTAFGGRGAATTLSKLTVVAAVIFGLTSLSLAVMSSMREPSLIREEVAPEAPVPKPAIPQPQEARPGQTPPGQTQSGTPGQQTAPASKPPPEP